MVITWLWSEGQGIISRDSAQAMHNLPDILDCALTGECVSPRTWTSFLEPGIVAGIGPGSLGLGRSPWFVSSVKRVVVQPAARCSFWIADSRFRRRLLEKIYRFLQLPSGLRSV